MKTVYLLCGVAGAGKSWIANQLSHLIPYISSDKDGKLEPSRSLELHDRTTGISTTISRWRESGIEVIPIFVMGDFLQVKQQLISRGGKVTANLYRRWKRIKALHVQYGGLCDSSSAVYKQLRILFKNKDQSHIIYKATSPSGKIYIGKTAQTLERRIYDHITMSKKYNTSFARAILKYGAAITWDTIEVVRGLEAANIAERKWISHYSSTDPNHGYNLTYGGDGGARTAEVEQKRINAIRESFTPERKKKISESSYRQWNTSRDKITQAITIARSTPESKAKTSQRKKEWYRTESGQAFITRTRQRNKDPKVRANISTAGRKARQRLFAAYKDEVLVGTWVNQADAAKDLNIPACGISRVLKGHSSSTHSYIFRYLETQTDSISMEIKEEDNHEFQQIDNNICTK